MSRSVEVVIFPRIAGGTVIGYYRKYTVGMATGEAVVLDIILRPAEIRGRGLGDTWRSRTPRGGRSGTPSVCAKRPSLEGHVTSPDPFLSGRRVRLVGVGRIVTGAVQSLSCLASQVQQCCYSIRDGGAVTEVGG